MLLFSRKLFHKREKGKLKVTNCVSDEGIKIINVKATGFSDLNQINCHQIVGVR